jgi:GDPmannose 4,6-dehydratase
LRALITGVTGQDGSYLAEHLTADGWEVAGLIRGQANPKRAWIASLVPGLRLVDGDLLDQSSLQRALADVRPDVVFNLAAATFVGMSWQQPTVMSETTGMGVLRMLEAIRATDPGIVMVHASSSEMFGCADTPVQDERTPLRPVSPYGVAKTFAHHCAVTYRASHGLRVSTVIMFNHESPRRSAEFVTRKVTTAAAAIAAGTQDKLLLGRLEPRRDWGWAPDYMRALPLVAAAEPGDWVIATGQSHSVADLCAAAFAEAGLDWRDHVVSDTGLHRPSELWSLRGDPARIRRDLGWEPQVMFADVVRRLMTHDLEAARSA